MVWSYLSQAASASSDPHALTRLIMAARAIRDAMPLAISIDNFLDAHQGDEGTKLCGKLAIVKSVLDAETNSLLYHPDPEGSFDMSLLGGTWYLRLAQLITEDVRASQIEQAVKNISIITFNYDRCIEHFLRQAFITYYRLPPSDAESLVSQIPILHPYGQVGLLEWQEPNGGVPFGEAQAANLLAISKQIRTFTEQIEDEAELAALRQLMDDAKAIVFLGFAYHRQNMRVLSPVVAHPAQRKTVLGTTLGLSSSDVGVISGEVGTMLPVTTPGGEWIDGNRFTPEAVNCHDLLSAYARTLTSE